jgi:tyrosinase
MRVRKNIKLLSVDEKSAFIAAIIELKKLGDYDRFIKWHHHAMMCPTPLPGENPHWRYRNAAHRGPVFLPWHRDFINELELLIQQKINSNVTLPYWDWTEDALLPNPAESPIWREDFMGGSGTRDNDYEVSTGPFAYMHGNWEIPVELGGPKLRRGFGEFVDPIGYQIKSLPTKDDLKLLFEEIICDSQPWNSAATTVGFRNRLEGWVTKNGDYRVVTDGVQLHNRVHVWIGGTMASTISPGDPVFFLHHCFVDKLWADWIAKMRQFYSVPDSSHNNPFSPPITPTPGYYLPIFGGPPGHNLYDRMYPPPWDMGRMKRPVDLLDHRALGYRYDTETDDGIYLQYDQQAMDEVEKLNAFI